jgi:CRP-like cAMP-binding protein
MPDREKRELVEQLGSFPTLKGCTKSDLEALVDAGGRTVLPAGWPFVTQGEPADAVYFLLTGSARVYIQRNEVAQLGPGDIIGEIAFFGGGQRGATVTSSERVTALRVENDAMHELVEKHAGLRNALESAYNARTASTAQESSD